MTSYSPVPTGIGPTPKKTSTTMIILCASMLGVVVGLLGLNYWHTSGCANSKTPDEMEIYVEGIQRRLLQAESLTIKNGLVMEKLLNSLQSRLIKLEATELDEITRHSQDEAVRLVLLLAAQPAPPMPEFELDPKYQDAEKLADAIDDFFGKSGGKDDYNEEERKQWEEFDDDDKSMNKVKEEALTITDAEATAQCIEWKDQYSVVQGASWGSLPLYLQQQWLKYACDYHFSAATEATSSKNNTDTGTDKKESI